MNPKQRCKLPLNVENGKIFLAAGFVSILMQHKYFFASKKLSPSGCSHVGSLFTNKEQKRQVHDVVYISATSAGLVHDVTDTNCLAQNGDTHDRVFMTFKYQLLTN